MQAIDKNVKRELMRLHRDDPLCEEVNPRITFRHVLIALLQEKIFTIYSVSMTHLFVNTHSKHLLILSVVNTISRMSCG